MNDGTVGAPAIEYHDARLALMDNLLGEAASKFLQCVASVNCMRHALRTGNPRAAEDAGAALGAHTTAAYDVLRRVTAIAQSVTATQNGGLVH